MLCGSNIKQFPIEIGQLTYLHLLDLHYCIKLEVIPTNVISNMKMLEDLYMNNSFNQWQVDEESNQRVEINPRGCLSWLGSRSEGACIGLDCVCSLVRILLLAL